MSEDRQERFAAYVAALAEVIGHADRMQPLHDYCRGLLLPGECKSVEPIAAITAPARVSAKHQSLLHFVANAPWSNERVLGRIQELTVPKAAVRSRPGSLTTPDFRKRSYRVSG